MRANVSLGLVIALNGCSLLTPPTSPVIPADDAGYIDAGMADSAVLEAGPPDAGKADVNPDGPCTTHDDCVVNQRCSTLGFCHDHECLAHPDCEPTHRCVNQQCLTRVDDEQGIVFERYWPEHLAEHRSLMPSLDETRQQDIFGDFGFGAALLDIDGDRDLDVFIGVQSAHLEGGSAPCIYENVSVGSTPQFRPGDFCNSPKRDWSGGYGFDVEGDGYHELVVTGDRVVELIRFHPEKRITNLLALVPEGNPRRDCNAGAATNVDLNFDGRLDLVVACHFTDVESQGRSALHLVFVQDEDGQFSALTRDQWNTEEPILLEARNSTIGIGSGDLNDDGLIDLMVSEDYYTKPPNVESDPGGIYFRCTPQEACRFRPYRLGNGERERGGYMGSGILYVQDRGELVYFTDFGPNRMCQVNDTRVRDFAMASRADLAEADSGLALFSWGVAVDDYNRDGFDDLLVAQGAIKAMPSIEYAMHFPAYLQQNERGQFSLHSDDVGLQPYSTEDSLHPEYPYAGRGLLRTDLDNDGYIDTIELGIEGVPRLHREVPLLGATPRCTIIPQARYVPGFGVGHSFRQNRNDVWRKWDSQGQLKSGTTPFLLSPWQRGTLRFPSGATADYDCQGKAGPVVIEESPWLTQTIQGEVLTLTVGVQAPEGVISVFVEPDAELLVSDDRRDGVFVVNLPMNTQRYMLRFGDRWLARWWRP